MVVQHAARRADAVGVGSSGQGRKGSFSRPTRGAFGVRRVAFAVGEMSSLARRRLAARFRSELAGVRALLKRAAEFLAPGAGKGGLVSSSSSPAAPRGGKDGRFLAAGLRSGGAPVVAGSKMSAKKRKACFLLEREDAPQMAPDGRKRLAARLASLSAAELPAQIGELSQRHRQGSSGKAASEVHSVDQAALFVLKQKLDKCTEESMNHGHEPTMDASAVIHPSPSPSPSPRQRQAADGKIGVEEEEDVDICGGVSPLPTALSPIFLDVDYSELVGATGVKLLSPLHRKYIALAKRADVCGGATAAAPALPSSLLPAGYSELIGATGVNLLSPLPRKHVALAERVDDCVLVSPTPTDLPSLLLPGLGELAGASETKMLSPLPRKYVTLAERVDVCPGVASTATTLPSLLSEHEFVADATTTGVKMLSPLPHKYVALAEDDDEYVDICGDASPVVLMLPKNHAEIISDSSSPSSSSSSDSDSGSSTSSDSDSGSASAAGSTPAPAIPTNACVISAQPWEPSEPEVAQSAKQEETKLPGHPAAAPPSPPKPLTNLIARAQGAVARRRQEEKAKAREKARRELLDMERHRTAPPSSSTATNAIHPLDMTLLGLAAVEYMVSSDASPEARPRSVAPSLLEKLGLFLKADDDDDDNKPKQQQQPSSVGGADDDVEEGEIR
uniref:Uncharacterized protein n=1 Tax=Oryza brachyantha TaxID=4533 RepID=J3LEA5_ORYBR